MSSLKGALIFFTGVAIGSIITLKLVEDKCEQRIQEEVDSVKQHFFKKEKQQIKESNEAYEEVVSSCEYSGKVDYSAITNKKVDILQSRPRVISPDDFGETGYSTIYLSYYADNILADDEDNIIKDVENAVGTDFVNHFGEYEDDIVHIRNDVTKSDYEIVCDKRNYMSLIGVKLHQTED